MPYKDFWAEKIKGTGALKNEIGEEEYSYSLYRDNSKCIH